MKRLLLLVLAALAIPTVVNGEHLSVPKELKVISESTKESIALAKSINNCLCTGSTAELKNTNEFITIHFHHLNVYKPTFIINNSY
mgnify:CR=1 FL=1